jgi:hypothetical protein
MEARQLCVAERTKRIQEVIPRMMLALVPAAIWIWTLWQK